MMAEHILYTIAIVLIVGIYYSRYTVKKYLWWIIISVSLIPDLDHLHHFPYYLNLSQGDSHQYNIAPWIEIGDLHNILWMILLAILLAAAIELIGKAKFRDALLFCLVGYGIHLFEDFISYPPTYPLLYPFTNAPIGINLIPETMNLGWAGTEVLGIGLIILTIAIGLYIFEYNKNISEVKVKEE